jgi:hypothetical protein
MSIDGRMAKPLAAVLSAMGYGSAAQKWHPDEIRPAVARL